MNSKELVETVIKDIANLKATGVTSIDCDKLIIYLNNIEHAKGDLSVADLEFYKATNDVNMELFKVTGVYGQSAIKSLFLLNAGAVAIMLTFVTHLTEADTPKITEFINSIWWFAVGVFSAVCVTLLAYVSQLFYYYQTTWLTRIGIGFHIICALVAGASLLFFWEGLTLTLKAFEGYKGR